MLRMPGFLATFLSPFSASPPFLVRMLCLGGVAASISRLQRGAAATGKAALRASKLRGSRASSARARLDTRAMASQQGGTAAKYETNVIGDASRRVQVRSGRLGDVRAPGVALEALEGPSPLCRSPEECLQSRPLKTRCALLFVPPPPRPRLA